MPIFDVFAGAALVCGLATWIVPLLRLALSRKPRSSLEAVGFTIGVFVVAAYMSAAGLVLALLAFVFAQDTSLARFGLLAIAVFWVCLGTMIGIAGLRARVQRKGIERR
jgi:L-asparagine transporter-like permease